MLRIFRVFSKRSPSVRGGSHASVKQANKGTNQQSHHLIAQDACKGILSPDKGPAIAMTPEDHQKTASWGRSKGAMAFRQQQRLQLLQGCPDQALQMGIDDVRAKFGAKYDSGIKQAQEYYKRQNLSHDFKNKVAHDLKNKVESNLTTSQKLAPLKQTLPNSSSSPNSPHQLNQKLENLKQATPQNKSNNASSPSQSNVPTPNP